MDSGATSHMIKDESLFIDIDKEYSGTITNANSSKSLISGKGTVEIRVLDSSVSERKIRLINALLVPKNTRNLVSVSEQQTRRSYLLELWKYELRTEQFSLLRKEIVCLSETTLITKKPQSSAI